MAFLCPGFKGRADYEDTDFKFTSGLESSQKAESPSKVQLLVTHDFQPTVDDEMAVSKGEVVVFLYRENEWNYVVNRVNKEGFIPAAYCAPLQREIQPKKPLTKDHLRSSTRSITSLFRIRSKSHQELNRSVESSDGYGGLESDLLPKAKLTGSSDDLLMSPKVVVDRKGVEKVSKFLKSLEEVPAEENKLDSDGFLHSSHQNLTYEVKSPVDLKVNSAVVVGQFDKSPRGQYVVDYNFNPSCPDDLQVTKGQIVVGLNTEDPDWTFVRTSDGHEGFVPHSYISPLDQTAKDAEWKLRGPPMSPDWRKLTELLATDNFSPEAQDDLLVVKGDRLYTQQKCENLASLNTFVWAFSPRLNQHGFVPLSHLTLAA